MTPQGVSIPVDTQNLPKTCRPSW